MAHGLEVVSTAIKNMDPLRALGSRSDLIHEVSPQFAFSNSTQSLLGRCEARHFATRGPADGFVARLDWLVSGEDEDVPYGTLGAPAR